MAQMVSVLDKLVTSTNQQLVPKGYISEMALTPLQVKNTTGKIGKVGKGNLRVLNMLMGGQAKAQQVDSVVYSTDTYSVERHGLSRIIGRDDFANVEQPFDARVNTAQALTNHLWLGKEKVLADALTDPAQVTQGTTLVGAAQFSDYANSDPLEVLSEGRETVFGEAGVEINAAAMSWAVAEKLRYHPAILDSLGFKYNRTLGGGLTDEDLRSVLKVDKLLISKAVMNTSKPGQADNLGSVWNRDIVLFHAPERAEKDQVTLGYYITLQGQGSRKVYRNPIGNPPESEEIILVDDFVFFLMQTEAAYLIQDAIAA